MNFDDLIEEGLAAIDYMQSRLDDPTLVPSLRERFTARVANLEQQIAALELL